jgi:hypothetical protein
VADSLAEPSVRRALGVAAWAADRADRPIR